MKSKILSLIFLTALVALLPSVSAALVTVSSPADLTDFNTETNFKITVNENLTSLTLSALSVGIVDEDNQTLTATLDPPTLTTTAGDELIVNVSIGNTEDFDFLLGEYTFPTVTLTAENATVNETEDIVLKYVKTFCEEGEVDAQGLDLVITEVRIENDDGDDDNWSPLDKITVEVEVEVDNGDDERVRDVVVELGLFDENGKNIVDDLLDLDEEQIDLGRIDDGKSENAVFTFRVPADFKEQKYRLAVKAFSEDEDLGEETLCTAHSDDLDKDFYQVIEGERESDEDKHVVVTNVRVSPAPAECGDFVQVHADVYNIGDADYKDQVKVTLVVEELGIELEKVLRGDLDEGDDKEVVFEFEVPKNAVAKTHSLEFRTFYDYNDRLDGYDLYSEDVFIEPLELAGACLAEDEEDVETGVQITARLDSETPEAVAGKQAVVIATLKNTGILPTTYIITIYGNSDWSEVVSIEPQTLVLNPGESKDVSVMLRVDDDAEGERELTIKSSFGNTAAEQKVILDVKAKEETVSKEVSEVFKNLQKHWFIYLIVMVNILLIIAIIAVVKRIASPRIPDL